MTATFKSLNWWQKERSQTELVVMFVAFSVLATILLASWGNMVVAGIGGFVSGFFFGFGWKKLRISGLIANIIKVSLILWLRWDMTPLGWFVGFFFICILVMAGTEKE
jgi:hypothetical protein